LTILHYIKHYITHICSDVGQWLWRWLCCRWRWQLRSRLSSTSSHSRSSLNCTVTINRHASRRPRRTTLPLVSRQSARHITHSPNTHTHDRHWPTVSWSPFFRSAWFEEITRIRLTSFRMCVTLDANYHAVEDSVDFTCKLTPISRWLSDGTVAGFQFGPSCQGLFTTHKCKWIEVMWTSRLSYAKSPASAL